MNRLEDRIRNALHDAGRPAPMPDGLPAAALARARRQRQQRAMLAGTIACTAVAGLIVAAAWAGLTRDADDVAPLETISTPPPDVGGPGARSTPTPPSTTPSTTPPPSTAPSASVTVAGESAAGTVSAASPSAAADTPTPIGERNLLGARADGTLVEIDVLAGTETDWRSLSFEPVADRLALAPDRLTVYAGRARDGSEHEMDVVRLDPDGSETVVVEAVTAFALRPDGQALVVAHPFPTTPVGLATAPSRIVERNLGTGTERAWDHAGYEQERVTELAYSPDSTRLAYVSQFESGFVRWFRLDSTPPAQPLSIRTGTRSEITDVAWNGNTTLAVVDRCCGPDNFEPPAVLMLSLDGGVFVRWPQDADDISIAAGHSGWTAIVGPTLVVRSSEESDSFGSYAAVAF